MSNTKTNHGQRVSIIERHEKGESLGAIARTMGVNYYTVRKWWRRYSKKGWKALELKQPGPKQQGLLKNFDPLVRYVALRLKRQHPGWGADVLLLHMSRRASLQGKRLPKRSALASYLHAFRPRLQEHRRLLSKHPKEVVAATTGVHQRWQMDFKGEVRFSAIGNVQPFIVCDEWSSTPLAAILHTKRSGKPSAGMTVRDVQADLRTVFTQWSLPDQLRMDRDSLFIGSAKRQWPGTLLLWLVGLDISPVINRPSRPTDNAQVERLNRTWYEHVALGDLDQTAEELQAASDQAWSDRRALLPSRNPNCHEQPPLSACPELLTARRPFRPELETQLFDLLRVYEYLAQWLWQRKVDSVGRISLTILSVVNTRDRLLMYTSTNLLANSSFSLSNISN